MNLATPWLKNYGDVPFHLDYPDLSMSSLVLKTAKKNPKLTALSYLGRTINYKKLADMIEKTAKAFSALGVKEGQRVTICLPNIPQAVYCLYALNKIGAVVSMIHPLSAVGEIEFYLKEVNSDFVVTLDLFYSKFVEVEKQYKISKMIITTAADELDFIKKSAYKLINFRKKPDYSDNVICWNDFLTLAKNVNKDYNVVKSGKDIAVILFSGGTTGVTKGIMLTNLNFNALALQTEAMSGYNDIKGTSMLAAMPMFHGFGLGICVHTMMVVGGISILVPKFNVKQYAKLIKSKRPNFIAGVPTLFEAITRSSCLKGVKLDCLKGVFSGGDSLSIELKKKIDKWLQEHGATVGVREGYGTTECVTASCLTPYNMEKEGSIGVPYPDTYYKICALGTTDEVAYGVEGEICLCGPTVMAGYLNNPEENANTLKVHKDGRIWLHTGDLGVMDEDGFIYFKQRIKRMIITSGYNVYPSQIENILDTHPKVQMSCVIGVKDPYKMQKVKAYVILKEEFQPSQHIKEDLFEYCRKNIAKYAMPYDIEFRDSFPKTLVGKVAYTVLEKEAEQLNA